MRLEPLARKQRALRLAPLVDVVFLLLVFFMLVSRLEVPRTLDLEPPSERGGAALQGSVLVRLGPDGALDLNGSAIQLSELPTAIAPLLARDPKPRILVQPAYEAALQDLVGLLDALRTADADDLFLLEP